MSKKVGNLKEVKEKDNIKDTKDEKKSAVFSFSEGIFNKLSYLSKSNNISKREVLDLLINDFLEEEKDLEKYKIKSKKTKICGGLFSEKLMKKFSEKAGRISSNKTFILEEKIKDIYKKIKEKNKKNKKTSLL